MKIQCPAKINLDLKITSKREDGFHEIKSVMQTISLYDYLTLEAVPSQKFEINLSGNSLEIPYNEKNLVYKAILLFVETVNSSNGRGDRISPRPCVSCLPPSRQKFKSEPSFAQSV